MTGHNLEGGCFLADHVPNGQIQHFVSSFIAGKQKN